MRRSSREVAAYLLLLAICFVGSLAAAWSSLGAAIDNNAYDVMFRLYEPPPWRPHSMLLVIDEDSFRESGGPPGLRKALAEALERLAPVGPKAVAVDVILADEESEADDARLEAAMRVTPNLVLDCDLVSGGEQWEDPLPRFRRWAAAIGHVYADAPTGVLRSIPLEKATARERRWALSLEVFRLVRGASIVESPQDLELAGLTIPAPRKNARSLAIRYIPVHQPPIPRISLKQLRQHPELAARFSGKAAFVGVTAQTATHDRWLTPLSDTPMTGVEIHANAFETIAEGLFLFAAPDWAVAGMSLLIVIAAGAAFRFLSGWKSYLAGAGILAGAHALPYALFTRQMVFPFTPPVFSAWLSVIGAAGYQHFVMRRRLRRSETEKTRYRQAMHFVTHEMRTPLTAIQGSSELMSRYQLSEEKRKQIAALINSESKRLGKMIEIFLNVERLSAGQIELKKERFTAGELVAACLERVRPLAERKQIQIALEPLADDALIGDRELMEYAFFNLLTNAVKYSPPETQVTVYGRREDSRVHISVKDQGIGIDEHEVRKIFQRFYRTKRAEESGEAGTGIGLSIVEQIVNQHGGAIEVTSSPGRGSCFTVVLPAERN